MKNRSRPMNDDEGNKIIKSNCPFCGYDKVIIFEDTQEILCDQCQAGTCFYKADSHEDAIKAYAKRHKEQTDE